MNHWTHRLALPLTLCPLAVFLAASGADEASATPADAKAEKEAPVTDESSLRDWARDLSDESYSVRDKAQSKLAAAGESALGVLVDAAKSQLPEVRARAVDILRRHAAGEREPLRTSATKALEELARLPNAPARAAATALAVNARRREWLDQQNRVEVTGGLRRVRILRPVAPIAVARVDVAGGGGGLSSLSIRVVDGKRTIWAERGDEKVEISDGGDDGIKMSIAKKVDGKEKTEKFTAKDANELKTKHAEAFKVYERYTKPQLKALDVPADLKIEELRRRLTREAIPKAPIPKAPVPKAPEPAPKAPPLNHVDVPDLSAPARR